MKVIKVSLIIKKLIEKGWYIDWHLFLKINLE